MELAIDRAYPALSTLATTNTTAKYVGFLMDSTPPTNAAEVKQKVDLTDLADVHAKCVGTIWATEQQYNTLRDAGTSVVSLWPDVSFTPQFKGGSKLIPSTTYQAYMPDRIFRVDGRKLDFHHCSARFLSYCYHQWYEVTNDNFEAFRMRESTSEPADVAYQLEYDTPRTVTAVRYGGHGISGVSYVTVFALQYYDEETSTWKSALSQTLTAAQNTAQTGTVFTLSAAVTAKLFRMVFTCPAAAVLRHRPCLLLGTEVINPPQVNPKWIIFVPVLWTNYPNVIPAYLARLRNIAGEYDYMPAIIDTAGYNNGGKVQLDASFNIVSYTFALGNIK
jgi:hypothetical protein